MCLRCDMLLLVPGFALTMILEGNSLTRSFSLHHQTFVSPRALRQLQTCLGKAGLHWQLLEALLLNIHRFQFQVPKSSSVPPQGKEVCHTLPGLHKGPENPHSMKEKPPYPKHSQDRTTGLGACAGWPTAALASLLAGWPADAQPALSRWHSSSHCLRLSMVQL